MSQHSGFRDKEGSTAASGRASGALERVTVNLTPKAARALEQAVEFTGDTKTDAINRALQIYAYVEQVLDRGGSVYVRDEADSHLQLLKIF